MRSSAASRPRLARGAAKTAGFGALLRTPLDRATGTLTADLHAYASDALGDVRDAHNAAAAERLAVYNRQYWFRLLGVMQTSFPLAARLLGHWHFNDYAARFLRAHPPHHWALDRVPDGFAPFLAEILDARDARRDVLVEAARIDLSWRELFRAPAVAPFRPSTAAGRGAPARRAPRLLPRDGPPVAEHFPSCWSSKAETRVDPRGMAPVLAPARLPHARWWMLVREPDGVRQPPAGAAGGRAPRAPRATPRGRSARAHRAACTEAERAELPAHAQRWLARSVERGFWVGFAAGE